MSNSKEPIRLRKRKTSTGRTSLYLDIYLNGKRSYEYLKLYLIEEKTKADREKNRQTMQLAASMQPTNLTQISSTIIRRCAKRGKGIPKVWGIGVTGTVALNILKDTVNRV